MWTSRNYVHNEMFTILKNSLPVSHYHSGLQKGRLCSPLFIHTPEKKMLKLLRSMVFHLILIPSLTFNKILKIMNKAELIDAIAGEASLTKADAKRALDAFIGSVEKSLKKGDQVVLIGFGTFKVATRSARNGRNPQTGKPIKIKAKKVVKFKAGADLSKKVAK